MPTISYNVIAYHVLDYPRNCTDKAGFLAVLAADLGRPTNPGSSENQFFHVDNEGLAVESRNEIPADQLEDGVVLAICYTKPSDRIVLAHWPMGTWGAASGAPEQANTFSHEDGHDVVYLSKALADDLAGYYGYENGLLTVD